MHDGLFEYKCPDTYGCGYATTSPWALFECPRCGMKFHLVSAPRRETPFTEAAIKREFEMMMQEVEQILSGSE